MKKLFIICIPTLKNIQTLKNLYILLASGCTTNPSNEEFSIRPVFIMQEADPNIQNSLQELELLRQEYDKIRTGLYTNNQTDINIFRTRIIEAYTISNTRQNEEDQSVELIKHLFQEDKQTYSKGLEWEQFFRSNSPNAHVRITEQDSVLFILSADKPDQTVLAKLLFEKKWVKKANNTGLIVDLSCPHSDNITSFLGYGTSLLTDIKHQIFIPDTGKWHFDVLLSAIAIVDFFNGMNQNGLINLKEKRTEYHQFYHISDLSNDHVQNSLIRFFILSNTVSEKYHSEIKQWQKNYNYSTNAKENLLLERIKKFCRLYCDWIDNIRNDFRFYISHGKDRIDQIQLDQNNTVSLADTFRYLNKLPALREFNNAERKRKFVLSIIDATYKTNIFPESSVKENYTSYSINISDKHLFSDWKQIPNPFALFLLYQHAFEQNTNNDYLQQRSFCLDLWEMFFCMRKKELDQFFSVEEVKLKTSLAGHYCDVLNSYKEFQQVFPDSMEVFYFVIDRKTKHIIAYSSPYTGFCVRHEDVHSITFNDKTFFSQNCADWKDLSDRSVEFRIFLKKYVDIVSPLSSSFLNYVRDSLSLDERVKADSENFFKCYSQYRNHIPIINN